MTPSGSEADARIAIDDLLRAAGWDPRDKSQIGTEILSGGSDRSPHLATRAEARPFDTHAPVYDLPWRPAPSVPTESLAPRPTSSAGCPCRATTA